MAPVVALLDPLTGTLKRSTIGAAFWFRALGCGCKESEAGSRAETTEALGLEWSRLSFEGLGF